MTIHIKRRSKCDAESCTSEELPDSLISECRYKDSFEKRLQYMDGSRALEYARSNMLQE